MDERVHREPATDADGAISDAADLTLKEQLRVEIRQLQFYTPGALHKFCRARCRQNIETGASGTHGEAVYLRYGPRSLYIVCGEDARSGLPPDPDEKRSGNATDISHGKSLFRLKGKRAYQFLRDYSSLDLDDERVRNFRMAKCRIGDFQVLMWWRQPTDVCLLLDRSYAQAFVNFLRALAQRWAG